VSDEWNPNDPEATRVHYDLSSWTFEQTAELSAALADEDIPHAWDGDELMVPEEVEERTDDVIALVEMRLGIAGESESREPIALADHADAVEYDLEDWNEDERKRVTSLIVGRGVAFRWEDEVLLVGTDDEELVDAILDEVEAGADVDEDDVALDEDGDRLPFETLTTFFLAGERLQRNPLDADGLEQLLEATDVADPDRPPYGVDKQLWTRTCELADELAAALVDGDEPDMEETQAVAAELHDLLRPYI
jgi:hypothetical protein